MQGFEFFKPTPNQSQAAQTGSAGLRVAGAQVQAAAMANVGKSIGDALFSNAKRQAVADKTAEFADLLSNRESFDWVTMRKAGSDPVLGPILQDGTNRELDGDALTSFMVSETAKKTGLPEDIVSGMVNDAMKENEFGIMRPETKGRLARLEGDLTSLGIDRRDIESMYSRLGSDKAQSMTDLQTQLESEARDQFGMRQFIAAAQGVGGQIAGQSTPAAQALERRRFEMELEAAREEGKMKAEQRLVQMQMQALLDSDEEFMKVLNRQAAERQGAAEVEAADQALVAEMVKEIENYATQPTAVQTRRFGLNQGTDPAGFARMKELLAEAEATGAPEIVDAIQARLAAGRFSGEGLPSGKVLVGEESLANTLGQKYGASEKLIQAAFDIWDKNNPDTVLLSRANAAAIEVNAEATGRLERELSNLRSNRQVDGIAAGLSAKDALESVESAQLSLSDATGLSDQEGNKRITETMQKLARENPEMAEMLSRTTTNISQMQVGFGFDEEGKPELKSLSGDPGEQALLRALAEDPFVASEIKRNFNTASSGPFLFSSSPREETAAARAAQQAHLQSQQSVPEGVGVLQTPEQQAEQQALDDFSGGVDSLNQ